MRGGVPRRRCCAVSRSLRASPRIVRSAPNTPLSTNVEGECVQLVHWAGEAGVNLLASSPTISRCWRPATRSLRLSPTSYEAHSLPLSMTMERWIPCTSYVGRERQAYSDSRDHCRRPRPTATRARIAVHGAASAGARPPRASRRRAGRLSLQEGLARWHALRGARARGLHRALVRARAASAVPFDALFGCPGGALVAAG